MVLAFKTYVLPILDYCSPVWSPHNSDDIRSLESVQRTFTKRLTNCSGLTNRERLDRVGLSTLEHRRLVAYLVLFYKLLYNLVDIDITSDLKLDVGNTTGHPLKVVHLKARINSRLYYFSHRTVRVWNALDSEVVCASSITIFRNYLTYDCLEEFLTVNID